MSRRTDQVADLIKQEVAQALLRDFKDPGMGFVTVTRCKVTPDLGIARLYFSVMGTPAVQQATMHTLEGLRKPIRGVVGRNLHLRRVPELEFFLDDTMRYVATMNDLLDKVRQEREAREGIGADAADDEATDSDEPRGENAQADDRG